MDESSLHAQICDLIGEKPEAPGRDRPTIAQAARQVRPGQVLAARKGKRRFCVARLDDGRTFAVPDHCPHDGNLLSDGFVDGDRLVCARHGWEFDLDRGSCPMRSGVAIDVTRIHTPANRPATTAGPEPRPRETGTRGNRTPERAGILTTSHEI